MVEQLTEKEKHLKELADRYVKGFYDGKQSTAKEIVEMLDKLRGDYISGKPPCIVCGSKEGHQSKGLPAESAFTIAIKHIAAKYINTPKG